MWDSWYYPGKDSPAVEQCNGGASLKASISAKGHFIRTFPWKISKSVVPDTMSIASGGSATAFYLISVVKGAGRDAAFIDGQVCVTNVGAVATENLSIVVNLTTPPHSIIIASVPADTAEQPVLAPGKTFCYDYRTDIPNGAIIPSRIYRVIASVIITNHSEYMGAPFGPSPSDTATLAAYPALINDTIHVDDTDGRSFTFSSSGSQKYEKVYTCLEEGENINTATINETGQQSSAGVEVICDGSCPATVNETVCVQADVMITPNVEMGTVGFFSMSEPTIGACSGTPVEKCTFTVSQSICVQIPIAFSANAAVAPAGVAGETPVGDACNRQQ